MYTRETPCNVRKPDGEAQSCLLLSSKLDVEFVTHGSITGQCFEVRSHVPRRSQCNFTFSRQAVLLESVMHGSTLCVTDNLGFLWKLWSGMKRDLLAIYLTEFETEGATNLRKPSKWRRELLV